VRSDAGKVRLTKSSAVAVVATNTAAIRHDTVNTAVILRGGCWDGGRVGIVSERDCFEVYEEVGGESVEYDSGKKNQNKTKQNALCSKERVVKLLVACDREYADFCLWQVRENMPTSPPASAEKKPCSKNSY
jgi:hypothetical protein